MKFWNRLTRSCAHQFSWPRVDAGGQHYQICLLCGTAYEYDWGKMRRTRRLVMAAIQPDRHPSSWDTHQR